MPANLKTIISEKIAALGSELDTKTIARGEEIFQEGKCLLISQSASRFELEFDQKDQPFSFKVVVGEDGAIYPDYNEIKLRNWEDFTYAGLLSVARELKSTEPKGNEEHKKYTREGMRRRVLTERKLRAGKAEYKIKWADNIYGDHILTNERGIKYKVLLRDFENETGYSDSEDARINKLGTTKHIMYAFEQLKSNQRLFRALSREYPFIEIYCDPLRDYKISWYYPHELSDDEKGLLFRFFDGKSYLDKDEVENFLQFIDESKNFERIKIRPEVIEKVEATYDRKLMGLLEESTPIDFSAVKMTLFPYQEEGIRFVLFKKAAIIADEMGLGKTMQAIAAAIIKKRIFGFQKTLVVCPASLKAQWKKEIEKFSDEKAAIVEGRPDDREKMYRECDSYFLIVNYETILRDASVINRSGLDFLILDEAQRVKNFETKTAAAVKRLDPRHTLVITGTPIENRLIDIFSIMSIIDKHFFGPLWEFSYRHCLFDPERKDKINGYYNLASLNKKLKKVIIRRQKREVIDQLPNLTQIDVPVELSPLQAEMHASYGRSLKMILQKKFLTPFDLQRIQMLLMNMRMVCDSTYLIDDETNESPKLQELKYMLIDQLDIKNNKSKIIIFSEWKKVHKLLGDMLREEDIGFLVLNGDVPVKKRGTVISKFEKDPKVKVFLSTEAGGSGLNLQVADTLINFELPWNPAKKNQRIGRIDRLGQKSNKLTIYNFITRKSIEESIAAGLIVKQNLFEGVLDQDSMADFVDFSSKGRSQFIKQLEEMLAGLDTPEDLPAETTAQEDDTQELIDSLPEAEETAEDAPEPGTIDLGEEGNEDEKSPTRNPEPQTQAKAMEEVMNNGMQFLAGLYKMSTGKDMGMSDQKIEVNQETGEVVMRFRLGKG